MRQDVIPYHKRLLAPLAGAAVIALATLGYVAYRQLDTDPAFTPEGRIDLAAPGSRRPAAPAISSAQERLRVAVAPVVSPERSLEIYQSFVEYLGARLGRRTAFLRRPSYSQVNDLVRFDQCDLALVCTYAYILGEREFGMKLLAIPRVDGATTYRSYIIVRAASPAKSLLDLKGKRFASADVMSSSGWLYPMTWLKEHGEDARHFFAEHIITGSHDRSIFAVASGLVDGAAVDSLIFDDMTAADAELEKKLRVIDTSPPFGMPPLVVPASIDPALERALLETLLGMHEDEAGLRILEKLGIDRFVRADTSLYDSVRRAAALWEGRG